MRPIMCVLPEVSAPDRKVRKLIPSSLSERASLSLSFGFFVSVGTGLSSGRTELVSENVIFVLAQSFWDVGSIVLAVCGSTTLSVGSLSAIGQQRRGSASSCRPLGAEAVTLCSAFDPRPLLASLYHMVQW